jgi:hypothetical protein
MAVTPVTWRIIEPPRARDGDSVYLVREREIDRTDERVLIERDPKRVLCRLTWLACPEISGPKADPVNGPLATKDAQNWLDRHWFGLPYRELIAVQYGHESFGRPLVDVRTPAGESLSIWMTTVCGWDVYR